MSFRPAEFNRDLCTKEGLNFHVLSDPDRSVIKRYDVWDEKENTARRVTFWVGRDGVIRRVWRDVNPSTMGQDLIALVKKWNRGQAIYSPQCGRCHGEDGNATDYVGIKTLGGIGNRHSEAELIKIVEAGGFVDLSQLSREELEALFNYIAGL